MTLLKLTRSHPFWHRSPQDSLSRLQDEVAKLLEAPFPGFGTQHFNEWAPSLDLFEDKENLVVQLEVPGMKREAFEVGLHDGVLSISGERKAEEKREKAAGYRTERFAGRFQRSIALPKAVEADKVRAAYKDGVLTVTLPIAAQARPKQIAVGTE
jgi:HSP20 family protein